MYDAAILKSGAGYMVSVPNNIYKAYSSFSSVLDVLIHVDQCLAKVLLEIINVFW